MADDADALMQALRAFGRDLPGAHGKSPWPGHDDLAVRDKTFAYLSADGEPFSLSCKLPYTGEVVLARPDAAPTGYGLGRSGWVTITPDPACMPALEEMKDWVDESYRAQAPKRLVRELDERD